MDRNTLYLKAIVQQAQKLPEDALPHLGTLAHLDLWLSARSRRLFHRAIAGIFGYGAKNHKRGMQQLLSIRELDYDLGSDLVREANALRRPLIERENVRKFFRAMRKSPVKDYYELILDRFDAEGEDVMWSIMDGTAFVEGGMVSRQIEEKVNTQSRLAPASPSVDVIDARPEGIQTESSGDRLARTSPTSTPAWHKPNQWYHLPQDTPPAEFQHGRLDGTCRELSSWLRPKADERELKRRAVGGSVWVRRILKNHWEAWFREAELYHFANSNRLTQHPSNTE